MTLWAESEHVRSTRGNPIVCRQCNKLIKPGDRYVKIANDFDGFAVYMYHVDCNKLWGDIRSTGFDWLVYDEYSGEATMLFDAAWGLRNEGLDGDLRARLDAILGLEEEAGQND